MSSSPGHQDVCGFGKIQSTHQGNNSMNDLQHLINKRQREMVFSSLRVHFPIINTHRIPSDYPSWNKLIFIIVITVTPPFFGTTCIGESQVLSEMG